MQETALGVYLPRGINVPESHRCAKTLENTTAAGESRMRLRFVAFALIVVGLFAASAGAADQAAPLPPDPENTLYLDLTYGRVVIRLRPDLAPNHVERIKHLVRGGLYDGLAFHRVIDHFMAQTGDPSGNSTGNTGRTLKAEFTRTPHGRGTVSMARGSNKNSADSEWFIVFDDSARAQLDGQYTVWGQVTSGMEFVDMIKKGDTRKDGHVADPDRVVSLQLASDADSTVKAPPGEVLKTSAGATAARNFSGTEFRCVALERGLGVTPHATLARLWTHGFLAGRFKAQNALTIGDTAEGDLDAALSETCAMYPGALLFAAANQKLAAAPRPLPIKTVAFATDAYTCKDYTAARGGANKEQADVADLWAFAFVQGYKSLAQPDVQITFDGRTKILAAIAPACTKNPTMSFLELTGILAAKVKIK